MNKLLAVLVASTFVLGSAFGFAADAAKKKEELTTEQKTEIRDRVERMKADRVKAEQIKTAPAPAKAEPKHTSKAKTSPGKTTPSAGATVKKTPDKV